MVGCWANTAELVLHLCQYVPTTGTVRCQDRPKHITVLDVLTDK